jgi:ParB-like chromosome segregation protein Spo0J
LLLDGHMRLDALRFLGATEAACVVADDDEAFTYNKRVNRLATIQEHYMIVRALDRGVPGEAGAGA